MTESIGHEEGTRGTETSKYPEEEKINNDFLSSGERTGKRPNQRACSLGLRASESTRDLSRTVLESTVRESNGLVSEKIRRQAGTRVPQDTRNPVGSREDHLPSLNTIW